MSEPEDLKRVPVSVLVNEGIDAGVVDWLAARVADDGAELTGSRALMPALATAANDRLTAMSEPLTFTVSCDPNTDTITVDCDLVCTLAAVRDLCLFIAATCTDLRPGVAINRNGKAIQSL